MTWRIVVVTTLVGLVVGACGPSGRSDEPHTTPTSVAPRDATTTAGGSTSSTPGTGPTTVDGAGPTPTTLASPAATSSGMDVLAGQFTAFIGAGAPGDCDDGGWNQPITQFPYAGLADHRVEAVVGSVEALCLVGFDLSRDVELAIATPDGDLRYVTVTLTGDGRPVDLLAGPEVVAGFGTQLDTTTEGSVTWWIRPDAALGTYEVVAVQDLSIAATQVVVSVGDRPSLAALPSDDPAVRRFAAYGFSPGAAPFGIYRDTEVLDGDDGGTVFELSADLGVVDFDTTGADVVDVPVAGLASGGWHCVHSPVLADHCAGGEGYVDPDYVPWG